MTLAAFLVIATLPEIEAERPVDVLIYGYTNDTKATINSAHLALLESKGYVVKTETAKVSLADMKNAKVVVGGRIDLDHPGAVAALRDYVYGGGHLLLLPNTQYSYCTSYSEDNPCLYDFTRGAFGFRFAGTVQYSTIYPSEGQETHPLWTTPNRVTEFTDWCCDAYVEEIIDKENITVLSTVSGQSYIPSGYHSVQDVPAIVVNDNPDFNGGMVIGAGSHMIIGWHGPDMRLFENVIVFMLDHHMSRDVPVISGIEDMRFKTNETTAQISKEMLIGITAIDAQDPNPPITGYAISFTPGEQSVGPFTIQDNNEFPIGITVIIWVARDDDNNVSTQVQRVTVTQSGFDTIKDGFVDGNAWEEFGGVVEYVPALNPAAQTTFNRYGFSIDRHEGSPAPSAKIGGDGFGSYAGIQRNVSLELLGDDDLFVYVDYKADGTVGQFAAHASMQILDEDGNLLYVGWMGPSGTFGAEWHTFSYNVTETVSDQDAVTVRLGVYDPWGSGQNVASYFDNFYMGIQPPEE